jgi:molecular chaperone GrpE
MTDQQRTDSDQRAGESPPAETQTSKGEAQTPTEVAATAGEAAAEASDVSAAGAEDAASDVERDLDELAEARRERDEYLELAQRTKADFENYRKRVAKETAEALARGKADLARELLPALDNLERALEAGLHPSTHQALVEGVAMVRDELHSRLEGAGVESFDPTGEKFDPQLHEALSTKPEEGTESGVILETVQKGYRLDGQVLRAAKVVVSQ